MNFGRALKPGHVLVVHKNACSVGAKGFVNSIPVQKSVIEHRYDGFFTAHKTVVRYVHGFLRIRQSLVRVAFGAYLARVEFVGVDHSDSMLPLQAISKQETTRRRPMSTLCMIE